MQTVTGTMEVQTQDVALAGEFEALRAAIAARDPERAHEIAQRIEHLLARRFNELRNTERELRDLMTSLDASTEEDAIHATLPGGSLGQPPRELPIIDIDAGAIGEIEIEAGDHDDGHARHRAQVRHAGDTERLIGPTVTLGPEGADRLYPVWYGTNRRPDGRGGFGNERNDRITHGRADVFVPKNHRTGETGNGWLRRLLRLQLSSDRLRLQAVTRLDADAYHGEISSASAEARALFGTSHALVFLHGYRVSFEDAAIRAAQLGCDLDVQGPTAFFSWPSKGELTGYIEDGAAIEASERAIADFLDDFCRHSGAETVHLIAHSMGNRGLLRALQRIAADAGRWGHVRLGQIFLAAPDIDRDLFLDLADLYPRFSERTTLYASGRDLALWASSSGGLHGHPRAGYFTPYTVVDGIDTIAVPDFNVELLGHSVFAKAEALLYDIGGLMRTDLPPGKRQRIAACTDHEASFWSIRR
jgi:esterase/lipase superfamily enzyme